MRAATRARERETAADPESESQLVFVTSEAEVLKKPPQRRFIWFEQGFQDNDRREATI